MKTAVVTGTSGGLGLEIARALLRDEWRVAGLSRRSTPQEAGGGSLVSIATDVRKPAEVRSAFAMIKERFGKIDLLVNNAAIYRRGSFSALSNEEISDLVDTNLKGPLYCTREALEMMNPDGGRIINISSVAGTRGIPGEAVYCATKHGLNGFSEALGQELAARGVLVTSLCPGGIDTPLWNPSNPYPGKDRGEILKPDSVAEWVVRIGRLPRNVVMKEMVLFPATEWH